MIYSSYCPGGPDSDFEYSTQSYTVRNKINTFLFSILTPKLRVLITARSFVSKGYEPTSMRAIRARYDPYEQSKGRVEQLRGLGHSVDKVNSSNLSFPLLSSENVQN